MYIIANLAVGGTWPGSPDETTRFPAHFDIDFTLPSIFSGPLTIGMRCCLINLSVADMSPVASAMWTVWWSDLRFLERMLQALQQLQIATFSSEEYEFLLVHRIDLARYELQAEFVGIELDRPIHICDR